MRTLLLLTLCSATAFAGDATSIKETRTVAAFHAVDIATLADVDITIGPTTKVEVSGPAAWLPKLEIKVENGSLEIRTPGVKDKQMPTFKVTITTPDVTAIAVTGLSNVHATGLHGKSLSLAVDGAATFDLAGKTDSLALAISGAAELKLKDFVANDAALEISGLVSGAFRANHALAAQVSGTATLEVYGKPQITKAVSGIATFTMR